MIKTTFHYSEQEIGDFFRFHLMTKENTKWIYYGTSILLAIFGAIASFGFQRWLIGILLIVAAIIFVLIFPLQVNRTIKKQVASRYKRPPQHIIFSKDHIKQTIDQETRTYQWQQIVEINETKKYMYFYLSPKQALIVNKETLKTDELKQLIDMIKVQNKPIVLYKNK